MLTFNDVVVAVIVAFVVLGSIFAYLFCSPFIIYDYFKNKKQRK